MVLFLCIYIYILLDVYVVSRLWQVMVFSLCRVYCINPNLEVPCLIMLHF